MARGGLSAGVGYQPAQPMQPGHIGALPPPEQFSATEYAAGKGYQPYTPTGQPFPTDPGAYPQFLKQQYGMDVRQFQAATPEQRQQAFAGQVGAAPTYEKYQAGREGGEITGPPKTPQEAAWATFMEAGQAREQRQEMFQSAVGTMQYAFGLLRRGGEGSLGAFQSPMLSQIAQMQERFEPEVMNYDYWLTPGAYGIREPESIDPEITGGGAAAPIAPTWSATGMPRAETRAGPGGGYRGLWG